MYPPATKTMKTSLTHRIGLLVSALFFATLALSSAAETTPNHKAFDYDKDGKADLALRQPTDYKTLLRLSADSTEQTITFGKHPSDIPVSGDFDGDGIADIAVRRAENKVWYVRNSSSVDKITNNPDGITRKKFGMQPTDIPVPADYDGDGVTDIAFRRPANHTWYILNSSGVDASTGNRDGITRRVFGKQTSDIPVPADYDGDGKIDIAVRRPSNQTWYILNSGGQDLLSQHPDGISRVTFGRQTQDIPVPADYDGDGKADIAVRRPSQQVWYIRNSSGIDRITNNRDGITRRRFGLRNTDLPAVADYDGDGRADIAVRRPASKQWFILNSAGVDLITNHNDGITRLILGNPKDIPLAQPVSAIWDHSDIDADGLNKLEEQALGTNFNNADSDGDGLSDGKEVNTYSTDPNDPDSDNDGVPDGEEVNNGTDPNGAGQLNRPPVLAPIAPFSVPANQVSKQSLSASDPDKDILTFAVSENSPFIDASVNGDELTISTRDVTQNTLVELTLTVSDGQATDTQVVAVTITASPINTAPSVVLSPSSLSIAQGQMATVQATVSDAESSVLATRLSVADQRIINAEKTATGFNITGLAVGSTVVTYTATDDAGLSGSAQLSVVVSEVGANNPPSFTLMGEQDDAVRIPHASESVVNIIIDDPDSQSHDITITSLVDKGGSVSLFNSYSVNNENKTLVFDTQALPRNMDQMPFEIALTVTDDSGNALSKTYGLTVFKTANSRPTFTFSNKVGRFVTVDQNTSSEISFSIEDDDLSKVQLIGIDYWYGDQAKFDVTLDAEKSQFTVVTKDVEVNESYGFVIKYVDVSLVGTINVELQVRAEFTEADQQMRDLRNNMIKAREAVKEYVYIGRFYAEVLENLGYITQQQAEDYLERLDVDDSDSAQYATFNLYIGNIESYIVGGDFQDEGFRSAYTTTMNDLLKKSQQVGQSRYQIINDMALLSEGRLPDVRFEPDIQEYDTENHFYSRFVGNTAYGQWVEQRWVFDAPYAFMEAIQLRKNDNAQRLIETIGQGN